MQYLITDEKGNGHLPVRKSAEGPLDHHLMGAAWAALHEGFRGNKYEGPGKAEAIAKLKALYKSEGMPLPGKGAGGQGSGASEKQSEICAVRLALDHPITRSHDHPMAPGRGGKLYESVICVPGKWVKGSQHLSITAEDLSRMVENFNKRKNDCVVIDYEHASEDPTVARGGPIPAAGWIHSLSIADCRLPIEGNGHSRESGNPGLKALIEWTPLSEEMIRNGQYRFFSPAIDWEAKDKESGEPQGATLTSGALTNHPFLEELPPLRLSETAGATVILSADSTDFTEENNTMKKLNMQPIPAGQEHAGHHGVFDGDGQLGYMTDGDIKDYAAKNCGMKMADTSPGDGEGGDNKMSELLGTARKLILSECFKPTDTRIPGAVTFSDAKAIKLMREGKITGIDYAEANQAEKLLDRAVRELKILPRDRAFYLRDAIERPAEFAEFITHATPVIRLDAAGIGSGEQVPVDEEVDRGVKKLMSEHEAARKAGEPKLDYGKALKQLFRENAGLEDRYRAAHRRVPRDGSEPAPAEGTVH
jgi:hypothetical protein